jgi:DNA-binding NarL/FixJ family response regulator
VSKNSSTDEVVNAARHAVSAPQTFTAKGLAKAMQSRMAKQREEQLFTDREREVLLLLAQGKSTSEVSKCLFVSVSTAKTHISKVYQKLGVHTRSQALMEALRLGLLPQGTSVS